MYQSTAQLPAIQLVGICCRTNNDHIFESDPVTNKIAATVQQYFHGGLSEKIQHRKNPGTTFCVYMEYESDFRGDYTFFIGEAVSLVEALPEGLEQRLIPAQHYASFRNEPGPMPAVCIDMWKKIWTMGAKDFGSERAYIADFEIYEPQNMADHTKVTLDIYIGLK